MCTRTLKMSFIGDFSLQNVRSNFQRQTNKKTLDVSLSPGSFATTFLNSGIYRNWKDAFFILEIRIPHPYSGFEILMFSLGNSRQRQREAPKLVYKMFLTINEWWHTQKSVECLPPLLQPKHLLNQYFKRHYDIYKSCASLAIHYLLCLKPPDSQKLIPLEHLLRNLENG